MKTELLLSPADPLWRMSKLDAPTGDIDQLSREIEQGRQGNVDTEPRRNGADRSTTSRSPANP